MSMKVRRAAGEGSRVAGHDFTEVERLMLLYVLQNTASLIYPHELAFRFPVSEQHAARFSARLANLGWLRQAPRPIKKDHWYYAIHPAHVPLMRSAVVTTMTCRFTQDARSCYLSLSVLQPPYQLTKPAVGPRDRTPTDSAHTLRTMHP